MVDAELDYLICGEAMYQYLDIYIYMSIYVCGCVCIYIRVCVLMCVGVNVIRF